MTERTLNELAAAVEGKSPAYIVGYAFAKTQFDENMTFSNPFRPGTDQDAGFEDAVLALTTS